MLSGFMLDASARVIGVGTVLHVLAINVLTRPTRYLGSYPSDTF